jgi:hypothetical protein
MGMLRVWACFMLARVRTPSYGQTLADIIALPDPLHRSEREREKEGEGEKEKERERVRKRERE